MHLIAETPEVQLGLIDVSPFAFSSDEEIQLDGTWEFYWNNFLTHDDFKTEPLTVKKEFLTIPGNWTQIEDYPSHGYGTLRLKVTGLERGESYALYIPEMLTSFRFFINGEEVFKNGITGKSKEDYQAQFKPGTVSFETDNGTIEIICHISNYDHRNSGIWRSITFGKDNVIRYNREKKLLLEMFLSTILLAFSLFHIGIYIYRTEAKSELLFGLICLVLFFRTISTGEQILTMIFPLFPWGIARRMEYSPFFLVGPLFMTFLSSLFPEDSNKKITYAFIFLFSLFGLFFILLPVKITNHGILYAELLLILGIAYALFFLIKALIHKRNHALSIIIAFAILALASINDILFSRQLIPTMYLSSMGFLLFIFIQSQMLSRRYARSFNKVQALSLQLKGINESLSRFVPFQFLNYLKKNSILDVNLGDQVLEDMTILFADIRSFTSLSEVMSPEENFKFLNSFLSQVVPVIREQGGFVDKFIGDAIMALFPSTPDKAVKAALELQIAVFKYNEARNRAGYREISLGIGIHTGQLMLGTIGETNRMETTVIADAVNIASRLETLTKRYGSKIIISRELYNKMDDRDKLISRSLGEAEVKGKSKPIEIMELLQGTNSLPEQNKIENIQSFETALEMFRDNDFLKAEELFKTVIEKNPEDIAALYFSNLCLEKRLNSEKI